MPSAAIDLLAPLMPGDAALKQSASKLRQVRKWLRQLLKARICSAAPSRGGLLLTLL